MIHCPSFYRLAIILVAGIMVCWSVEITAAPLTKKPPRKNKAEVLSEQFIALDDLARLCKKYMTELMDSLTIAIDKKDDSSVKASLELFPEHMPTMVLYQNYLDSQLQLMIAIRALDTSLISITDHLDSLLRMDRACADVVVELIVGFNHSIIATTPMAKEVFPFDPEAIIARYSNLKSNIARMEAIPVEEK